MSDTALIDKIERCPHRTAHDCVLPWRHHGACKAKVEVENGRLRAALTEIAACWLCGDGCRDVARSALTVGDKDAP